MLRPDEPGLVALEWGVSVPESKTNFNYSENLIDNTIHSRKHTQLNPHIINNILKL